MKMRWLAICCSAFSAAIFVSHYLPGLWSLIPALIMLVSTVVLYRKKKKSLAIITAVCLLCFLAGCCTYTVHRKLTLGKVEKHTGDRTGIEAVVLNYPSEFSYYDSILVKISDGELKGFKARLYDDREQLRSLEPGDIIRFDGKLSTSDKSMGEDVDYNICKGIYCRITAKGDSIEKTGHTFEPAAVGCRVNRWFADKLRDIYDLRTSAFMISLMLGDKTDFYLSDADYTAISRAGFMHVIAVSGMHVAFLVGIIRIIFGKAKLGSVVSLVIIWLFVIVSGVPVSALRAAFMQSLLLLAPMFRRESDPFTTLSFALAVILLFNPFACAGISLQLSFAAVLGLIFFSEISQKLVSTDKKRKIPAFFGKIIAILASSLGIMLFTAPLSAIYFGFIPLLSPVMNLLCLWAVPLCFGLGYLSCFTATFSGIITSCITWVVTKLVWWIYYVAGFIKSFRGAAVYFSEPISFVLIAVILCVVVLIILTEFGPQVKLAASVAAVVICIAVFLISSHNYYSSLTGCFAAVDVGQGQSLVVFDKDTTVVIDCGSQEGSGVNAGDKTVNFLGACGRKRIDYMIFTHVHADHANGFMRLAELYEIGNIFIPNETEDSDGMLLSIVEYTEAKGIPLTFIENNSQLMAGSIKLKLYPMSGVNNDKESNMFIITSIGDYDMLVTGDSPAKVERSFIEMYPVNNIDLLIAGHHGSKNSACGDLLKTIGADTAIISCGVNNYGHPTNETLERLKYFGYNNIMRTDLNGDIVFCLR